MKLTAKFDDAFFRRISLSLKRKDGNKNEWTKSDELSGNSVNLNFDEDKNAIIHFRSERTYSSGAKGGDIKFTEYDGSVKLSKQLLCYIIEQAIKNELLDVKIFPRNQKI